MDNIGFHYFVHVCLQAEKEKGKGKKSIQSGRGKVHGTNLVKSVGEMCKP